MGIWLVSSLLPFHSVLPRRHLCIHYLMHVPVCLGDTYPEGRISQLNCDSDKILLDSANFSSSQSMFCMRVPVFLQPFPHYVIRHLDFTQLDMRHKSECISSFHIYQTLTCIQKTSQTLSVQDSDFSQSEPTCRLSPWLKNTIPSKLLRNSHSRASSLQKESLC